MARLFTSGFELNKLEAENFTVNGTGASTVNTTVRSGTYAMRHQPTSGVASSVSFFPTSTPNRVFLRFYINFATLPSAGSARMICEIYGTQSCIVRVNSNGTLTLWEWSSAVGFVSRGTTTAAASTGTWYLIEVSAKFATSGGILELKAFGETVTRTNSLTLNNITQINLGTNDILSSTYDAYFDDVCLNDDQGANQNTYAGEGKVVYLAPTSDNNRGLWTTGSGGTASLFAAVDNFPPAGAASETNTTNIRSAANSATDNCDLNLTTYSAAGIGASDTINIVQALIRHGEDISTGTKLGAVLIVSNPTQGSEDSFTYGNDVGAHGSEVGNWKTKAGTVQHAPSVTLGTSPVIRAGKRTSTTRVVCVDAIGLVVDYTPSTGTTVDSTITGVARVQKTTDSNVAGLARIRVFVDSALAAISRIRKTTDSSATGVSRIRANVDSNATGVSRITVIVDHTVDGKTRIRTTVDTSVSAVAKIRSLADNTLAALARVRNTVDTNVTALALIGRTIDTAITGAARIGDIVDSAITSVARMRGNVDSNLPAQSRITAIVENALSGIARISGVNIVENTLTALARVNKTIDETITGLGRIRAEVDNTIASKARMQVTVDTTATGLSRVRTTVDNTLAGLVRMQVIGDDPITSQSRLRVTIDNTIDALAKISGANDNLQTGKARLRQVADFTLAGIARVLITVDSALASVARVQATSDNPIAALGRVLAIVDSVAAAVASVRNYVDTAIDARARVQIDQYNDLEATVRMRSILDYQLGAVCRISGLVVLPYNPTRTITDYNIDRTFLVKDDRTTHEFASDRSIDITDDRTSTEWNTDRTITVKD